MSEREPTTPHYFRVDGYHVRHRYTPEILGGHVVGQLSTYTVCFPMPEGWMRWVGYAANKVEVDRLIRADQRWRDMAAGRKRPSNKDKEAA
jgi:hypothetical protein